jgi:hypothetical protein
MGYGAAGTATLQACPFAASSASAVMASTAAGAPMAVEPFFDPAHARHRHHGGDDRRMLERLLADPPAAASLTLRRCASPPSRRQNSATSSTPTTASVPACTACTA